MAETWDFNPGGCCCDDGGGNFPLCTNLNGVPLFLTDANGTNPMIHIAGDDYYVNYQFIPPNGSVSYPLGTCVIGSSPVSVAYYLACYVISGVTYAELSLGFVVNNDPCGAPLVHPYRIYQRSDSHPVGTSWPSTNMSKVVTVSYPLASPGVLEFTFPSLLTNGPPFNDYVDTPGGTLVTITT
jgi:hypothetical protein